MFLPLTFFNVMIFNVYSTSMTIITERLSVCVYVSLTTHRFGPIGMKLGKDIFYIPGMAGNALMTYDR